jgi:UDP-N-acetyl-D-mannosaminuronate dehydrogenase
MQELIRANAYHILVHDPYVSSITMKKLFDTLYVSLSQGLIDADIVVFLVAHERFKAIDIATLGAKKILDLCGVMRATISVKELESIQKVCSNNWPEISQ